METSGIIQGSSEWFAARVGKVTASRVADVMAKGKGSAEAASVRNYRAQLVAERLTGAVEETYTNAAMARGIEMEPAARQCYEFISGYEVIQVGFIDHPTVPQAGASPDGCINEDGLVEIKCPNTATHIDYLLAGVVPPQYIPQMAWQLACTGRKWCDFVSYDPRLPEEYQLFTCRMERDEDAIKAMEAQVIEFNRSAAKLILDLKALRP